MGVLSDEDLVVMRTRARHRMLGVLALVVLLVVGVPMLLDHQEPPVNSSDEAEPPVSPPPSAGPTSGSPTSPPAGATSTVAKPVTSASSSVPTATPLALPGNALPAHPLPVNPLPASPLPGAPLPGNALPARTLADKPLAAKAVEAKPVEGIAPPTPAAAAGEVPVRPAALAAASVAGSLPTVIPALSTSPPGKAAGSPGADVKTRGTANNGATAKLAAAKAEASRTSAASPARSAAAPATTSANSKAAPAALSNAVAEGRVQRGWFVQFGVFAELPRAEALMARLGANKVAARSELIHGPRGNFTRVRAGPFSSRASADEVLARVKSLGENAILVHQ